MIKRALKYSFLFLIVVLLVISFFQAQFNFVELSPLRGAITATEKKDFTIKDWLSGEYQEQEEKYINENFGFRSLFIRANNQIAYSLFKKAKANGVIIGKQNYLYERYYIKAYYGIDYIGADSIKERMRKLKFIQDTLYKLDKSIILVFAAGKGTFYPEYIPDKYKVKRGPTNYGDHVKWAKSMGLKFIDFNKYFVEQKYISKYPLYPQYGVHWSHYGACLAADSMVKYIERIRQIDLPNFYWDKVELDDPKGGDYDVANGMNLKFKLKSFKMGYPRIQFESKEGKDKVSVLVISDSFYSGMFEGDIITKSFSNNQFWFYNKQAFTAGQETEATTNQLNLKEEIAKNDVIIIMATEANLPKFGWGFIEETYNLFKGIKTKKTSDIEYRSKLTNLRNYIKTDKRWMKKIEQKANLRDISVDSMITIDAAWQLQQKK